MPNGGGSLRPLKRLAARRYSRRTGMFFCRHNCTGANPFFFFLVSCWVKAKTRLTHKTKNLCRLEFLMSNITVFVTVGG